MSLSPNVTYPLGNGPLSLTKNSVGKLETIYTVLLQEGKKKFPTIPYTGFKILKYLACNNTGKNLNT